VTAVEQVSGHVSKQYEELKAQVEQLRNQRPVESNNNREEVQVTRINNRQSGSMSENTLSSSDVRITHISEPLTREVSCNGSNQENVWNGNSVGFVREIPNHPLDLALPIFENKPDQNARAHLNALGEYLQIKNIPSLYYLAIARRSLKGFSVMTWADANWDQMKTFEGFRMAFLEKFWSLSCQAKVRLQIYQD
jgi:hypothetical protein